MLIHHFATPLNIEEGDLRQLVWSEGDRTAIMIESIHRWRASLIEKRPAIILKPNARKNIRIGLNNVLGTTAQGNMTFQTFWAGSHTLFCIHGQGASADILATEVQREVTQFAPVIKRYLDLYEFQVTDVGAVAEVAEARENFVSPITVAWIYGEKWSLSKEARYLSHVNLQNLLGEALVPR
jgi:hypothetical protein